MPTTVIPFPSQLVGLKPDDQVAEVLHADHGRALMIKPLNHKTLAAHELRVFAHNDLIVDLAVGDWVRFSYTSFGPLIIERLAKPGDKSLPRTTYRDGDVYVDPNDPAWRLYEN